jgi:lysozyme family protein
MALPILPLVALATTLVPEIIRLVSGERAGTQAETIAGQVAQVVTTVTGTDVTAPPDVQAAAAAARLAEDPALKDQLRRELLQVVLDAELERGRQDLRRQELTNANTSDARRMVAELSRQGGLNAYGAVATSIVVTLGFGAAVVAMLTWGRTGSAQLDPNALALLNVTVGALVAAFTAVVNFWIGSSQGSRDKDQTAQVLQVAQTAAQTELGAKLQESQAAQANAIAALRAQVAARTVEAHPGPRLNLPAKPDARVDMARFERAVEVILTQEGGYSDHPDDPGGATNMGITHRTLAEHRGVESVTKDDVKQLSREEAREIYHARYWRAMSCDELPAGVDLQVFDFGVNAGPVRSIRLLQRCVHVKEDGIIGPITLAAVRATDRQRLIRALSDARLEYYRSLSTWETFGRGWTRRTDEVREAALRMVAADAVAVAVAVAPVPAAA